MKTEKNTDERADAEGFENAGGGIGFGAQVVEGQKEADIDAENGADVEALHDDHADGQACQGAFDPEGADMRADENAQGDEDHAAGDVPRAQAPTGVGKEVHVQAGAQAGDDGSEGGETQLAEEEPGAKPQEKHGQGRIDFEVMFGGENGGEEGGEGRGWGEVDSANPPKIAPKTGESAGEPGGTGFHRAQGGVVGEENFVREETLVAEHGQGASEKEEQEQQLAALRARFRTG